MRASRLVTATFVVAGIVMTAANPGCSSSTPSMFTVDSGMDAPGTSDVSAPGADGGRDVTVGTHDAGKDGPIKLGTPDVKVPDSSVTTEAGFNDARPDVSFDVNTDAACNPDAAVSGPPPLQHVCIIFPAGADDNNECDGHHDPPAPFPANGSGGNGFDDNCNGLVDEGCSCNAVGTTKTCYLLPATQTVDGLPIGWCAQNSKGTVACSQHGESSPTWNGQCRGAQPPYASDFCSPGDFNCDGATANENCACNPGVIQCPTAPLTTIPYPPPSALPLEVNAAPWFVKASDVAKATDWKWTLTGGDCDNILPHPSFGIYASSNATGDPIGTQSNTLGTAGNEHGIVAMAPAVTTSVYPAFSLSGDYLLAASWTLNGTPYTCSVKVQVLAPGVRAEGCWDTEGQGDDLDLHMAKVNDFSQCATSRGWSDLPPACMMANEDCFYADCYATGGFGGSTDTTNWGYADSPASACTGWGSQSTGSTCGNPRLDRDANGLSGACDSTITNPNTGMDLLGDGGYCGPENINVDHPANNDRFAVGLRFYTQNATPPVPVHAHVNVYCDGVRVLSAGYDPTTAGANYPQLISQGADSMGDMWKVGLVTTQVTGAGLTCTVAPTQSTKPDPMRDGSNAFCVDDYALDGASSQILLTTGGLEPANANALCFH